MSEIITDKLTGKTSAGDVEITSEGGAVTMQLQQGLIKAWSRFDATTNTEIDSLNQSSRTDVGTGISQLNFANSMNNDDFASCCQSANSTRPTNGSTGGYHSSTNSETTALVEMTYGYASDGVRWTFLDQDGVKVLVSGDLA